MVTDLGWIDFDLDVPSSCLTAQPLSQFCQTSIGRRKIEHTVEHRNLKSTQTRFVTTSVTLYISTSENLPMILISEPSDKCPLLIIVSISASLIMILNQMQW